MTAHGKHEAWHALLGALDSARRYIAEHNYAGATGALQAVALIVAGDLARDPEVRAIEATKSGRDPVEWMNDLRGAS